MRRRCGFRVRGDPYSDLVTCALGMAVSRRNSEDGVMHRSDRGSQHGSLSFGKTLRELGIIPPVGSKGDPYDNAAAESFMATLKTEPISGS